MMLCWRSMEAEDEKNDLHYAFRSDSDFRLKVI